MQFVVCDHQSRGMWRVNFHVAIRASRSFPTPNLCVNYYYYYFLLQDVPCLLLQMIHLSYVTSLNDVIGPKNTCHSRKFFDAKLVFGIGIQLIFRAIDKKTKTKKKKSLIFKIIETNDCHAKSPLNFVSHFVLLEFSTLCLQFQNVQYFFFLFFCV